ncbi:uncharacterized protein LOC136073929 [Hydra vulgaris]|uniref:uncharacterized protein LOC136073929 n=1 Tax=Hydra vulgaris TaxID=6087 RepID=UPI0032E9E292
MAIILLRIYTISVNHTLVDRNANVNFLKHIRNYNVCLSFAFFKADVVQPINHGSPFNICGQIYHLVGNLKLDQDIPPIYSQVYYDLLAAVTFRMQQRGNDLCLRDLMFQLQTIITEQNKEVRQAAIEGRSVSVVKISLLEGGDRRCYNLPSHDEVAVVFVGEDGAPPTLREVVIYPSYSLKILSSMSANLDPMQYAVDAYVKIEGQRLAFIRNNQNKLRSEQYDALHEHVNNIVNDHNIGPGRVVVLPSSYREITENLYPGQTANDRPYLVTRVIEFQKRGLPHAHILLHLANDDKLETAQDINNLLCAEIPDPIVNHELYDIIKTCMIHGLCNRWVVPWFSKKYQAHINIKACMSVKAVIYLYKRIYKGHDCANVLINEQDHLPENQIVCFREGEEQEALYRATQRDTRLTAWFKLNSKNEGAHRYSYVDLPYYFVFDDKHCKWKAKKATSWEDLRTVNGLVIEIFCEACVLKGLLQDDTEWQNTLSEAVLTRMSKQINSCFQLFYSFVNLTTLRIFGIRTKLLRWRTSFIAKSRLYWLNKQLFVKSKRLLIGGKTLFDYNFPVVDEFIHFYLENLNGNVQQSVDEANRMRPLLNVNQLNVSNVFAVFAALNEQPSVENQHSRLLFMGGPAGSGKIFTYNYLIAETSSRGVKSATAAWTAIAATLFTNGSSLHGLFKLPDPILDNSTCNVIPNSI